MMMNFVARPIDDFLRRYCPRFYTWLETREQTRRIRDQQDQNAITARNDPNRIRRPQANAGEYYAMRLLGKNMGANDMNPGAAVAAKSEENTRIAIASTCFQLGRQRFNRCAGR